MGNSFTRFITSPHGITIIGIVLAVVLVLFILGFVIYKIYKYFTNKGDDKRYEDDDANYEEDREYFTKNRGKIHGKI